MIITRFNIYPNAGFVNTDLFPQEGVFLFTGDGSQVTVSLLTVVTSLLHVCRVPVKVILVSSPLQPSIRSDVEFCKNLDIQGEIVTIRIQPLRKTKSNNKCKKNIFLLNQFLTGNCVIWRWFWFHS